MRISSALLAIAMLVMAAGKKTTVLYTVELGNVPGKNITTMLVEYAGGESDPPHHHGSSFVIACVLEGAVESRLEGQPAETYQKGQWWTEPVGAHHVESKNANWLLPTRFLATLIHDSDDYDIVKMD